MVLQRAGKAWGLSSFKQHRLIPDPSHLQVGKEGAHNCLSFADGDEEDAAEDPTEQQAVDAAVAARSGSQEQPPPWLDVTTALQFMTDDGRLVFHAVSSY